MFFANLKMANEMLKDLKEMTIQEEDELLQGKVGEEAHLVDAEEPLGDDQRLAEEQAPQASPPVERVLEPSPMDTTMEVEYVVDRKGDKSPVQSEPEI